MEEQHGGSLELEDAIEIAREYVKRAFASESRAERFGLEETELEDGDWKITIGFDRSPPANAYTQVLDPLRTRRERV